MNDTTGPLSEQVALVTGASSGLGGATALALTREGARVALLARGASDLASVASVLSEDGHGVLPAPCDLADAPSIERTVERVQLELGPVRVLVNAAGTDAPGPISELSVDAWDRVLAVNLRAVFLLFRLLLPGMVDAGRGTIVNVFSVAGKRGWANASAYCASKFALTGFTLALAAEAKPHGVRACIVYPGAMATHSGTWSADERAAGELETGSPRQAPPPERVADLIAWITTAPSELVLNETIVSPLDEQGWP
jgi:3-oxoacyl-[acyl-carrier protein] reductase